MRCSTRTLSSTRQRSTRSNRRLRVLSATLRKREIHSSPRSMSKVYSKPPSLDKSKRRSNAWQICRPIHQSLQLCRKRKWMMVIKIWEERWMSLATVLSTCSEKQNMFKMILRLRWRSSDQMLLSKREIFAGFKQIAKQKTCIVLLPSHDKD